jgi:hypothetical protein
MSYETADEDTDLSSQLHTTLRSSIADALSSRRPLLTHLNADTTWLLSIPYPDPNDRAYFHILIDPWLRGGQADVAKFFSQQWHKEPSAVQTIAEVEDAIRGIEEVAPKGKDDADEAVIVVDTPGDNVLAQDTIADIADLVEEAKQKAEEPWIDAVIVSHEFTDHMHKETLLETNPHIPVFATSKAASIIRSWKHFDLVGDISRFTGDWRESSRNPLPPWLGISRLAYAGADLLYYHSGIMITFPKQNGGDAEAVIYTPHGISPGNLPSISDADPPIKTLALLHGLQDISLPAGAQLNLGAHNGLKVQRLLGAKYWIGTHDEVKKGGGIVSWFLNRKVITLQEAVEGEKKEKGGTLEGSDLESMDEVQFVELGNGQSLILE